MGRSGTKSSRGSVDRRIARVAARQHGAFSRAQAIAAGATQTVIRRRIETGRWVRLHRGVYCIAGAPRTWKRSLMAALLACGPGATVSHRAAAALLGLPGYAPGPIEILVPRGRRVRRHGLVVRETLHLPTTDVALVDGIRVTVPARTLIDLAALAPRELDVAFDHAVVSRLTTIDHIRRRLPRHRSCRGIGLVRRLAESRGSKPAPGSPLESRFLRLFASSGLPEPERQLEVRAGRRRFVLDFAWPERRLAVETEGFDPHGGRRAFERDRVRSNLLMLEGWRIFHATSADLERPDLFVAWVAQARHLRPG